MSADPLRSEGEFFPPEPFKSCIQRTTLWPACTQIIPFRLCTCSSFVARDALKLAVACFQTFANTNTGRMRQLSLAVAVLALALLAGPTRAFYLPGVAPQDFAKASARHPSQQQTCTGPQPDHLFFVFAGRQHCSQGEQAQLREESALRVLLATILPAGQDHQLGGEPGGGAARR